MRHTATVTFALLSCLCAAPAGAQQLVNITVGQFVPRSESSRTPGDVLVENRGFLSFGIPDFAGPSAGAEWIAGAGEHLEVGVGVTGYRQTVPSVYRDFIASDRTEIAQDLRLKTVTTAFTARFLPLGQHTAVQPYLGAGLGVVRWRYTESGDFVDFGVPARPIRSATFEAQGTEAAPVALVGIRFGAGRLSVGGEARYQQASADLDTRFAGSALDLGGWTYAATVGLRFGR